MPKKKTVVKYDSNYGNNNQKNNNQRNDKQKYDNGKKNSLSNLMTTIYLSRQLIDFLKKYIQTIYVRNYLKCKF